MAGVLDGDVVTPHVSADGATAALTFTAGVPDVDGLAGDLIRDRAGGVYMERWYLGEDRSVRFHHILRSDPDRDLHDHPWDFTSLLLSGSYVEVSGAGERLFVAPVVLVRSAEFAHRLILEDGPVWSYVVTGPVRRRWGFHTEVGWMSWNEYLGVPEEDLPPSRRRRRRRPYILE